MPRRAQLVCQHLENISREALEKHQEIVRQYVRGRQGVYALYRRGKLYYVGLATNLRNRLKNHLRDRHKHSWDHFSVYLTIGDRHLHELEALILRMVKPSGNQQKGKFARSEDLHRRFRQHCKRNMMAEIDGLFGETCVIQEQQETEELPKGRKVVLAKYISSPLILKAKYKGEYITARIRRDGTILLAGNVYTSPSFAGAAACKRKTCNGWTFWKYERAPGDWVLLDELRK
jgi:predicted GIY-YIG superfamily endonuclease